MEEWQTLEEKYGGGESDKILEVDIFRVGFLGGRGSLWPHKWPLNPIPPPKKPTSYLVF